MGEQRQVDASEGGPFADDFDLVRVVSATPEVGAHATKVLLVCTGNVCRSAVAEALLRHRLAALGSEVIVRSAGLRAGGQRADPVVIKLLRRRGIRVRSFRSTTLTPHLISGADLVLGMSGEHVEAVVLLASTKWPRAFTLKEVIRRSDAVGGRRPEESIDDWLARLHEGRTRRDAHHRWTADDVPDPIGRSPAEYEEMVNEVDGLTRILANLLTGTEMMPSERMSVASSAPAPTKDTGHSLRQGPDSSGGVSPSDDGNAEEMSMDAEAADAGEGRGTEDLPPLAASPDDGLRAARHALEEARQTLTEAAQQLAEALRTASHAQPTVPVDAYTQLGDEVAAGMRSAAAQSSIVRAEADRHAREVRSQAEANALALRERSQSDASEMRRMAEDDSATMRREAAAEREQAGTEAADLRRVAATEIAGLRDEADQYARITRQQADADAQQVRDEADRYGRDIRGRAEDAARTMRGDAEQDAAALLSEARARHAEMVAAECELHSRLEGAAQALVSALEGRQHTLSPRLALAGPDEMDQD